MMRGFPTLPTVLAVLFLNKNDVAGFTLISKSQHFPSTTTTLWEIRCEDKYYQLEEREDKECATTELYLMADRRVEFGDTDGPMTIESVGTWQVQPNTDNFSMLITRKFSGGKEGTDMGEFTFETVREFKGEMTMVGESVAITGQMVNKDELLGDEEVGFFNMIDGTKERESYALEGRFKDMVTTDKTKGLRLSKREEERQQLQQQQAPQGSFGQINWQQPQLGPGGLDPVEVFNFLPPALQEPLRQNSFDQFTAALQAMQKEESDYYLNGCVGSGIWVTGDQLAIAAVAAATSAALDPAEVLESLPPAMAEAFRMQDIDRLNAVLNMMGKEEADYHMKRCEQVGLWG